MPLPFTRLKTANDIPDSYFKAKKFLKGIVVSVGDGDGIRIVHTPLFFQKSRADNIKRGNLQKESISIRVAGIDAPECPNFGKPGQPFGKEAKEWLNNRLLHKQVKVQLFHRDQYSRAVAMVYCKSWIPFKYDNVCLEMLQQGMAVVYEGTGGSFGNCKEQFEQAEAKAKKKKIGLWALKNGETPLEYKKKHK